VKNGVLYRKNYVTAGGDDLLVVPKHLVPDVLFLAHDSPAGGAHLGITKTASKIRKLYYWDRMMTEIEKYVKSCPDCQTGKRRIGPPVGLLQSIKVNKPFDLVGMDMLGPFKKSEDGNRFVVAVIDYGTKYLETKAIPTGSAEEIAQFLLRDVYCRHGIPRQILSDRGTAFKSRLVAEITEAFGAKQLFSTAFRPQTNGLVEHINGVLAQMISLYVNTAQTDWNKYLPIVTFVYNTAQQATTKQTSFYLLTGREAIIPLDTVLRPEVELEEIKEIMQRLDSVRKNAVDMNNREQRGKKRNTTRDVLMLILFQGSTSGYTHLREK
jgi:hypothetical protein